MPVTRLLLGLLLSALVVLGAAPMAGADPLAQPTETVAPTGPTLEPAPTEEDAARSKNKLVIGLTAVVLLGIVIYGNRVRAKRHKKK